MFQAPALPMQQHRLQLILLCGKDSMKMAAVSPLADSVEGQCPG